MFYVKTPTGNTTYFETSTEAINMARVISEGRPGDLIEVVQHQQYSREENEQKWCAGLWKEVVIESFTNPYHNNICGN